MAVDMVEAHTLIADIPGADMQTMDMQTAATEAGMVTTVAADTTEVQHGVVLAGMVVDIATAADK
jgi:hypothetical protein